ncbi:conserved hypothetical protein [Roseibium sp. TrichSKD4]|nr:conserved hypothetical protein [Roseibium sp. TrichSKD4]
MYPAYDLDDAYVFQSSTEGYTSFILSSNPSTPGSNKPPAGVVFGQGGLYNLHIAGDEKFKTGMTLAFSFLGEDITVSKLTSPNSPIGEKGNPIGQGKVGAAFEITGGIRIWAGRGNDPFFGNGIGLADFNDSRQRGQFKPDAFKEGGDLFANATASFIVADIPNSMLGDKVKYFTTTATMHKGEWRQVDRLANVLFPYVFLADTPAVQEDHQQHRPDLDVEERRQAVVNNTFWAVSVSGSQKGREMEYAQTVADLVMPDVITYTIGSKANYVVDELNGRPLQDDAMNTVLQLMNGVAIDDFANDGKRYREEFPYISPAK